MTIWQAIFLGIIQGFTEFLPISSSGHLVLLQSQMQLSPSVFYFDIFLHFISVIAIIFYFRKTLLQLDQKMIKNLIVATIPLLIVGFLVRDLIKPLFVSSLISGIGLIITAGFNFFAADKYLSSNNDQEVSTKRSVWIGLSQVIALIPGISRSGSTLFGASAVKIEKSKAFEFCFLMAIPAILAASFGELITLNADRIAHLSEISIQNYAIGGLVCLITSFASLQLLKITLNKAKYHFFGWYCLIAGVITLGSIFF